MNFFNKILKGHQTPDPSSDPTGKTGEDTLTFDQREDLKVRVVERLKTVFDPEIPVNIYDLGMIYRFDVDEHGVLSMDMTLTAPNCPAADFIMQDVRDKVENLQGITKVDLKLVFEPEWNKDMMSDEAKLELGFM
ncbi:MAG: DUF59 domain-containing protein [Paludibacteraceae bacterium]|nr:DUF59 domain-containing protein [Paludibacteraceae bacterium]